MSPAGSAAGGLRPLTALADGEATAAALAGHGLAEALADKAARFARAAETLAAAGAGSEARAYFVPGRIEVLGKHTDYCGGRSLVTAVEHGLCLVAAPRTDGRVGIHALDVEGATEFALDPELEVPHGDWRNYPMTVARRLARNFPGTCRHGADIAFTSDLPLASGMSSSSALVVATYLALADTENVEATAAFRQAVGDDLQRAEYLGTHENGQSYGALEGDRGVGTFGGSEDHTAILCSEAGRLGLFRYCPTRLLERVAMPAGWVFALGVSGVVAEKTGRAQALYNQASLRVRALVEAGHTAGLGEAPHLAPLLAGAHDAGDRLRAVAANGLGGFSGAELHQRLEHFEREEDLIDQALAALRAGDASAFGAVVDASQAATEQLLDNQVPETVALARQARAEGAAAASAFGAGFGGCVWALAPADTCAEFVAAWSRRYAADFPEAARQARFLVSGPGPAAFRLG